MIRIPKNCKCCWCLMLVKEEDQLIELNLEFFYSYEGQFINNATP